MHALVYINPLFGGSGVLHPLKNGSLSVRIFILLLSFKIDLKRVYMTKSRT